jgi:hypothetical protein
MISAASSVRATMSAIDRAGATVVVVGCLSLLGTRGNAYFESIGLRVESLDTSALTAWHPSECPLCAANVPLE